ncbi:MAG: hypothetical protein ACK4PR_09370 [Gammaproteobacteria bacterium]
MSFLCEKSLGPYIIQQTTKENLKLSLTNNDAEKYLVVPESSQQPSTEPVEDEPSTGIYCKF